jgi:kynureninase
VRTPRDPKHRGGTVSVWHPEAERLSKELIAREIICDYRPNAGIRLSPHFYNTEAECDHAIETLRRLANGEEREMAGAAGDRPRETVG